MRSPLRISTRHRAVLPALAALLYVCLGGCTTHQHSFAGHEPGEVWAGMLAVAEEPDYSGDWHVVNNIVTVDRSAGRIDVNRDLRRAVHEADGSWRDEQHAWQFRFELVPGSAPDEPPRVLFVARNPALPVQVHAEAARFFADLRAVLAGVPRPVEMTFTSPDGQNEPRP